MQVYLTLVNFHFLQFSCCYAKLQNVHFAQNDFMQVGLLQMRSLILKWHTKQNKVFHFKYISSQGNVTEG